MAKIRVYDLAKQLGLENKVLVDQLQQAGIEVKGVMSSLAEEDVAVYNASRKAEAAAGEATATSEAAASRKIMPTPSR